MLSWFCAESAPLTVNARFPNGPPASWNGSAAAWSVSAAAVIGRDAPSQYCGKSFETATQFVSWPGGSSASPLPSVWLLLQNGFGGAPSGLYRNWSQAPWSACLPATSALPPSLRN